MVVFVRRAILMVLAVTAGATLVGCPQKATVTVPLDCAGTPGSVTVAATMPRSVPSGSAFALTIETTGANGAVVLSLTNTTPGVVAVRGTSTVQVVSTGAADAQISLAVARVHTAVLVEPNDPNDSGWRQVTCSPTGPTEVGSIATTAPRQPADAGSTPVDVSFFTWCTGSTPLGPYDEPGSSRVSVSAPTHVSPGQTFTLSDLAVDVPGGAYYGVEVSGATVPSGTGYVLPSTPITVTAGAGQNVALTFRGIASSSGGPLAGGCTPVASGHLAAIPVVAAPG